MITKQQTSGEYGISQELLIMSILNNYGVVSIPYGNSARYDCILDIDKTLYKIQIKSLNIVIEFYGDFYHFNPKKYNGNETDYFILGKERTVKDKW